MSSSKEQVLRNRWLAPDLEPVAHQIADILLGNGNLTDITLRTPEGRIDLRGYVFPTPGATPWGVWNGDLIEQLNGFIEVTDAALHDIDFSHATMPHWRAMNAEFVNCTFDGADCTDLRLWKTDITNCTFHKTNLSGSVLGTMYEGRPDIWTNCDLTGADLRDCDLSDSDVYDCDFTKARIERITARHTTWERCTFASKLKRVIFDGTTALADDGPGLNATQWWMTDVDFSGCTFDDVTLDNYHLDTVTLPPGVLRVPNAPSTWAKVADHLQTLPEQPGRSLAITGAQRNTTYPGWTGGDGIYPPAPIRTPQTALRRDALEAVLSPRSHRER